MWQRKMFISVYTVFKDIVQTFLRCFSISGFMCVCRTLFFHTHQPSYESLSQISPKSKPNHNLPTLNPKGNPLIFLFPMPDWNPIFALTPIWTLIKNLKVFLLCDETLYFNLKLTPNFQFLFPNPKYSKMSDCVSCLCSSVLTWKPLTLKTAPPVIIDYKWSGHFGMSWGDEVTDGLRCVRSHLIL